MTGPARRLRLARAGVEVVIHLDAGPGAIVHWGAPLGAALDLEALAAALDPAIPNGSLDELAPLALVPEAGSGFRGRPGLEGARDDGSGFAPRFAVIAADVRDAAATLRARDALAGLALTLDVALDEHGVLTVAARLVNEGATPYALARLAVALPSPLRADEALTLHGRWAGELRAERRALPVGAAIVEESRHGRTSHEHAPTVAVGTAGFGEEHGEVVIAHLAWSGDHVVAVERLPDGRGQLQLGELLAAGEVVLAPGEAYAAPTVHAAWSDAGLVGASRRLHAHVRARPGHPRRPRPVGLNTWEAVYFDHDGPTLRRLAELAAEVGIERFVLDDGWFHGRRSDRAGLGDWWVDPAVHPEGLGPLIDHVRGLGLEFGIWVEPEMVNPDSDLYRAHPDWVLAAPGYAPVLGRHQLVLDLARPDAYAEILGRLDALLRDHAIAYVKWDMNRDHVQAAHGTRAGTHAQTLALYRLLDELARRHPDVEIESCSSGGARTDLGILARTCRIWTSDSNDALDRQQIQRGFSYLLPPELMGAHIGPPRSHTTGRVLDLPVRVASAFFGHLGVEWNLLEADAAERVQLAAAIAQHKRFRSLLHGGDVVRVDHPDPAAVVHGVLAPDRAEALVAYIQVGSSAATIPQRVRVPGLDREARYRVERLPLTGADHAWAPSRREPSWLRAGGVELTGGALDALGVALGVVHPGGAEILHLRRVG